MAVPTKRMSIFSLTANRETAEKNFEFSLC